MMLPTKLVVLFACLAAVSLDYAAGTAPVDAGPLEYPYAVKILRVLSSHNATAVGLAVSSRYIVVPFFIHNSDHTKMVVTDQAGLVRPIISSDTFGNVFAWLKVCKKITATKFSIAVDKFSNLAADQPGELIYFKENTTTLQKLSVTVKAASSCTPGSAMLNSTTAVCVAQDATPQVCFNFQDSFAQGANLKYSRGPMLAISGQVNGFFPVALPCGDDGSNTANFEFLFLKPFRDLIASTVPIVDNK